MPPDATSSAGVFEIGSLVGARLRIEAQLGRGGMSVVHRALDERSGKRVALKQLRVPRQSSLFVAQFEREYHTLCQLAHPRIIEVYDYGVERGSPYYTMELLDGEDLQVRGRSPWRQVCVLLSDVASSLAILHSRRLLHRDLSPRNVRCTTDGRAKLIDFGAMAAMGPAKNLVGTPPFIPPEALQLQALDGRADLYGLGALAYWTLTGYHAFHARSLSELRELWRCAPLSPREYEPDLPPALADLVMKLLQLDRAARPSCAAEVIELLSGIAGLPLPELPEVSRAYLVMPSLVGRRAQVHDVSRVLAAQEKERGQVFSIQGAAGSGRSRMLQACVLEAKLLGALVLRADAEDGRAGDYGVTRVLCEQLLAEQPELYEQCEDAQRALLDQVVGQDRGSTVPGTPAPERRQLQAGLRAFLMWTARRRPLVIAIDDFDAIDEPSAALMAGLGAAAGQCHLTMLVSCLDGQEPSAALALLQQVARPIALPALDLHQTEALLRSVFGDVEHVAPLAERVHRLAGGNPRATMALCERLVERRVARYDAGAWTLPPSLQAEDLPDSLTQAFASRLAALSADARELGEALSLTEPTQLPERDFVSLTAHGEPARIFAALDELRAADVLMGHGDRYRFREDALCQLLRAGIEAAQVPLVHARLARAYAGQGDSLELVEHLLCSGREGEATDMLLALLARGRLKYTRRVLSLIELAVATAERSGAPLLVQLRLRDGLVRAASVQGQSERFVRYAQALLERQMRDSGLLDCAELTATHPDPESRARAAVERARQRYELTPEHERAWPPEQSVLRLARLSMAWVTMVVIGQDLPLLRRLPDLSPLIPVSSEIQLAASLITGAAYQLEEQHRFIRPHYLAMLDQLSRYEGSGFSAQDCGLLRASWLYTLALYAAGGGHPQTREFVAELQQDPRLRVHAWRVRMVYELMSGNTQAAHACQRRAELLELQDGDQLIYPRSTTRAELLVHILGEDLLGVKRVMTRVEELAALYPGWLPTRALGRSAYLRLKGDLAAALEALAPGLELTADGVHREWAICCATQLELLVRMGRAAEAVTHGQRYLARAPLLSSPGRHSITLAVASALRETGAYQEARALIEEYIGVTKQFGTRGLRLALGYEARARLAIAMRDEQAFAQSARLCALAYNTPGGQRDLMLNAKYERLMREAEAVDLPIPVVHAADSRVAPAKHSRELKPVAP